MDQHRRELLLGSVSGLALAGLASAPTIAQQTLPQGDALRGPYLDLTTPQGNMLAVARMSGNLDLSQQKLGWYNGYVSGVRPGEPLKDLFGFAGFGMSRLLPHESGSGYRKVLREVGIYYDLKTLEPLEEYLNPYTGETVRVVPVANDPFNTTIQEYFPPPPSYGGLNKAAPPAKVPLILPWKSQGEYITLERHIHLFYRNALQPDKWPRESAGEMARVSEFFTYFFKASEMQDKSKTSLGFHGTWSRVTPWLPWMLMGQAEGHCQYMTYQGSGQNIEDVLPRKVLDFIERKYPLYLNAPTEWVDPSLSSIERYALEQQPAPVKR
jgi:hypothetical protein